MEQGVPPLHAVEEGLLIEDNISEGRDLASVREVDPVEAGVSLVSHKETSDH